LTVADLAGNHLGHDAPEFPFRNGSHFAGMAVGLWFVVPTWMMVLVPLAGVPIMASASFLGKVGIA